MTRVSAILICLLALGLASSVSAQEPVKKLQYMVGQRASVLDTLSNVGYRHLRTDKQGGSAYSYWRERSTKKCITARTANGEVQSIVHAPKIDCDSGGSSQSQGSSSNSPSSGGNWSSGSSSSGGHPSSSRGLTLYRDLSFTGTSETFTYDVPDMRKTRIGDDQATSVSVAGGCRARLYRDLNYRGTYVEVSHNIPDLRNSQVGDDSITSIQVLCGGGSFSSDSGGGNWSSGDSGDNWSSGGPSSSRGVTLHRDPEFAGTSETFTFDVPELGTTRIGNDQATSVSIGYGCRARLYRDSNYNGTYIEVTGNIDDLRSTPVGDDSVTSLQVRCDGGSFSSGGGWSSGGDDWNSGGASSSRGVTLHRDLDFSGTSETFTYDVPDMRRTRIGDDQATSVSIGYGCRARLYRDLNYQGSYIEVTSNIHDLRGTPVGDDSVTSLQVRCDR